MVCEWFGFELGWVELSGLGSVVWVVAVVLLHSQYSTNAGAFGVLHSPSLGTQAGGRVVGWMLARPASRVL